MARTHILLVVVLASLAHSFEYHEPEGAFGRLEAEPRQAAGEIVVVDDLQLYVVQPGIQGTNTKAIVWAHDIYGWNSGRTQAMVDQIAAETEYIVVLPDLFRGEEWPEPETYRWETELQVSALLCVPLTHNTDSFVVLLV